MRTLVFIILFIAPLAAGASVEIKPNDTPCDTIKLTDGRVVLGRIYYEDRTVVKFNHCNEGIKTKDELPMYMVKEIAYGSDKHNEPFVEDRSRLNRRGVYTIVTIASLLVIALLVVILVI